MTQDIDARDLNAETAQPEDHVEHIGEELHPDHYAPTHEELAAIMAEYDKESNTRQFTGTRKQVIRLLCIAFMIYCILYNTIWLLPSQVQKASFVSFLIVMVFLLYPARKKDHDKPYVPWYDWICMALGGGSFFYYVVNFQQIVAQQGTITQTDMIIGLIGIVMLFECCRRVTGWPLIIVVSLFIAYAYFGRYIPGEFGHGGYSLKRIIYFLFYTEEGIIGTPLQVCSRYIVIFILFGAMLEKTGIGEFFIDIANSLAGRQVGGPAKVAVIASGLQGTISGSSVANTVGSGSFTIPMMKRMGYRKEFAGAVEAAASTGGQIMPPIMGAAAFLMADITGIPYGRVILAASIPALLYFTTILLQVHFEARRQGLKGMPADEIKPFGKLMRHRGYMLIPIASIVFFLSMGFTAGRAALYATIAAWFFALFAKDTRLSFKDVLDVLENGIRNSIGVGVACAMAGCIVGVVTRTGLGVTFASAMVNLAGGNIIFALFLCMLASIVLGMGVPTTANYVIMATVTAPLVMNMGVPILAAHMFVFYFGIVADITPPVALAAYAGSAIARGNPLKTGIEASKLAIAAFLIPYIFALNPSLLFGGTAAVDVNVVDIVRIVITSLFGVVGISSAVSGFYVGKLSIVERVIGALAGILLVIPSLATDFIGVGLMIVLMIIQKYRYGAALPFSDD